MTERMASMRALLVLAAATLSSLAAGCADPRDASLERQVVRLEQRQAELFAALAARDAERLAAFYADDAVVHVADMPPIEGRAAIRRLYENIFGFLSASSSSPEALHVAASAGLAYGTGSVENQFQRPTGPVAYAGKYVVVWRRIDEEWMVALYAVSSNAAGD